MIIPRVNKSMSCPEFLQLRVSVTIKVIIQSPAEMLSPQDSQAEIQEPGTLQGAFQDMKQK